MFLLLNPWNPHVLFIILCEHFVNEGFNELYYIHHSGNSSSKHPDSETCS